MADTLTIISTSIAGITSAIAIIDHRLAQAESIIQNSVGPFLWALITRQPIKAQPKGAIPMKFNFDAFLTNFGKVAENAAVAYETKQAAGTSLHQVDYINMAIPAIFAIISAFQTPVTLAATTPNNADGSQPII
jgi:hypothetical protein